MPCRVVEMMIIMLRAGLWNTDIKVRSEGKLVLTQTKERRRGKHKKSYVVCMYSLQSFLVRPCFCLSPDIYFYLCCTSCWLCLHDIRPKPYTCPRQRWRKSEKNKMEGVHSLRLKNTSRWWSILQLQSAPMWSGRRWDKIRYIIFNICQIVNW